MIKAKGYVAHSATSKLEPFAFERRVPGPKDVHIEIMYCGICHSDLHVARNEWNSTHYPVVPGHEIVGKVIAVGPSVKKHKLNDIVAVGVMVESCRQCKSCKDGHEQYCETGFTLTYNSPDIFLGGRTYGGYSNSIVVDEDFVISVPAKLDIKAAAPLLCAGITVYSPLQHWQINSKHCVGVVGLGGLGHLAVKIAHAMGARVTMITTSKNKEQDAKELGAFDVLLSTDADMMKQYEKHFDFIINTIPRDHDINPYIKLLKYDGTMCLVGVLEKMKQGLDSRELIFKRRSISGSVIGGIKETQECLEFCAEHNVLPEVEIIPIDYINEAYERMLKNDVKYRFVIDMKSL